MLVGATMPRICKRVLAWSVVLAFAWSAAASAQVQLPGCAKTWNIAKLVRNSQAAAGISADWFRGIDLVRQKIDAQSGIKTDLYLCQASTANAFAWREDGKNLTAITTGMIRLFRNDWHGYAAVIGHENAHHVLHHGNQRRIRNAAFGIATALGGVNGLGFDVIGANYSQSDEFAADREGLKYALCAGFSSGGIIRFHENIDAESSVFHGHPSSEARIRKLKLAAKKHDHTPKCR